MGELFQIMLVVAFVWAVGGAIFGSISIKRRDEDDKP